MAIPTYQACGTPQSGTGNLTVPWPAHVAGDIGLLVIETAGQAAALGTANGFAAVTNSPQTSAGAAGGTAATRLTMYWCRATSSSMASPVVTAASWNHGVAAIVTFRGCVATGDPWDVTSGNATAAQSTSWSVNGATTTVADCLVVVAISDPIDDGGYYLTGWTNSDLANITSINAILGTPIHSLSGNGGGVNLATGEKATAGTYGATTGNTGAGGSIHTAGMTIALKPVQPSVGTARSVQRDGPSGWYVPETVEDFAALGLAAPDFLWPCQESAGSLLASIGASAPFVPNGTPQYQQTVSGWTRKFAASDGTANQGFRAVTTPLFDLAAGESAAMLVISTAADSGVGNNHSHGYTLAAPSHGLGFAGTTGRLRVHHNGAAVVAAGASHFDGLAHLTAWYRNASTNVSGGLSDLDSVASVHSELATTTGTAIYLAANGVQSIARWGWVAIFKGANAERDWSAYLATLRGTSGVGAALYRGAGATTAAATATATGRSLVAGAGATAGAATATAVGSALYRAPGAAAGVAAAAAIGEWQAAAAAGASGVAAATAVGAWQAQASATAAGAAAATGAGVSTAVATATAAGEATSAAEGATALEGAGAAAGAGTAVAVGLALVPGAGLAAGVATSAATGSTAFRGAGVAGGLATAYAPAWSLVEGAGLAAGLATALGAAGQAFQRHRVRSRVRVHGRVTSRVQARAGGSVRSSVVVASRSSTVEVP